MKIPPPIPRGVPLLPVPLPGYVRPCHSDIYLAYKRKRLADISDGCKGRWPVKTPETGLMQGLPRPANEKLAPLPRPRQGHVPNYKKLAQLPRPAKQKLAPLPIPKGYVPTHHSESYLTFKRKRLLDIEEGCNDGVAVKTPEAEEIHQLQQHQPQEQPQQPQQLPQQPLQPRQPKHPPPPHLMIKDLQMRQPKHPPPPRLMVKDLLRQI